MAVVSGGTTLIDNGTLDAGVPTGSLILLSTQTASASASISFTSGIDSTYDSYVFKFINLHPSSDGALFQFNLSSDNGSNYNVTKTSTFFQYYHLESDAAAGGGYIDTQDLAQSTAYQTLLNGVGSDNDQCCIGNLQLFNPSSTTFVKHFIARCNRNSSDDATLDEFVGGYGNTTSVVDAISFKFNSGNIDDGIIKMYGVG